MIHPAQEALTLRAQLRSRYPGAMVRWDESGKGLLVSDAPRHGFSAGLDQAVALQRGLAFFDLPPEGYRLAVLRAGAPHAGAYRSGWLAEQAALAAVLAHPPQSEEGAGALVPEALAAIARARSGGAAADGMGVCAADAQPACACGVRCKRAPFGLVVVAGARRGRAARTRAGSCNIKQKKRRPA